MQLVGSSLVIISHLMINYQFDLSSHLGLVITDQSQDDKECNQFHHIQPETCEYLHMLLIDDACKPCSE